MRPENATAGRRNKKRYWETGRNRNRERNCCVKEKRSREGGNDTRNGRQERENKKRKNANAGIGDKTGNQKIKSRRAEKRKTDKTEKQDPKSREAGKRRKRKLTIKEEENGNYSGQIFF